MVIIKQLNGEEILDEAMENHREEIDKVSKYLGDSLILTAISRTIDYQPGIMANMRNYDEAVEIAGKIGEKIANEIMKKTKDMVNKAWGCQ